MTTRDEAFAKLGQGHQLDDECKRIIAEEWGFNRVIRCKDCKHRHESRMYGFECDKAAYPYEDSRKVFDGDWFCADGERKEGEK